MSNAFFSTKVGGTWVKKMDAESTEQNGPGRNL